MDARQKLAIQVVCALICSEKPAKRKKRIWKRECVERRGQQGQSVLQRQLELHDESGYRELMTAEEFDFLLRTVGPLITKQNTKMRRAITPRERLSLTLRFLATGETFRSLSFRYRIGASTISQIVLETCGALQQVMKKDFLKTPSTEAEWRTIARDFEQKCQLPHCLGALDEKRIHIQPPAKSGSLPHDHNGKVSVTMMAAVDANYKFIHTSVDTQGVVPEAGLFAHSDLSKAMDQRLLNVPLPDPLPNSTVTMPYMFVGDESYPLRPDLMTPYPHGQLDHSQHVLNDRLSRAHKVAENAFGILANRFRVFRSTICLEPDKVVKVTMASLCIHNFLCERRSEAYAPPGFTDWENTDHRIVEGTWRSRGTGALKPVEHRMEHSPTDKAKTQRDILSGYFVSPAGCVPWQEEEHI